MAGRFRLVVRLHSKHRVVAATPPSTRLRAHRRVLRRKPHARGAYCEIIEERAATPRVVRHVEMNVLLGLTRLAAAVLAPRNHACSFVPATERHRPFGSALLGAAGTHASRDCSALGVAYHGVASERGEARGCANRPPVAAAPPGADTTRWARTTRSNVSPTSLITGTVSSVYALAPPHEVGVGALASSARLKYSCAAPGRHERVLAAVSQLKPSSQIDCRMRPPCAASRAPPSRSIGGSDSASTCSRRGRLAQLHSRWRAREVDVDREEVDFAIPHLNETTCDQSRVGAAVCIEDLQNVLRAVVDRWQPGVGRAGELVQISGAPCHCRVDPTHGRRKRAKDGECRSIERD
eukprot:scaffold65539_cov56-Phaeocystis_antarctica.AAC.3